jgi:hypothetical protein
LPASTFNYEISLKIPCRSWSFDTLGARASCDRSEDTTKRLWSHEHPASLCEFNILTLFVIGQYLCESFHWLTDERRLANERTRINLDQSQTDFKYWTHQGDHEAGCSCDQSLLVVSSLLSQEALAPRVESLHSSRVEIVHVMKSSM